MKPTSGPGSASLQALMALLRTADTIWNASRQFFARWKISPSQFNVLNLLGNTTTGTSQSELSRQLIMHRSNVTGLVDRLEARGLVSREEAESDRRAYKVVLTREGRALLDRVLPEYYTAAGRLCGIVSPSRLPGLIGDLQAMAEHAERMAADLPFSPAAESGSHPKRRRGRATS